MMSEDKYYRPDDCDYQTGPHGRFCDLRSSITASCSEVICCRIRVALELIEAYPDRTWNEKVEADIAHTLKLKAIEVGEAITAREAGYQKRFGRKTNF